MKVIPLPSNTRERLGEDNMIERIETKEQLDRLNKRLADGELRFLRQTVIKIEKDINIQYRRWSRRLYTNYKLNTFIKKKIL